jgi:hypothetical protein
MIEISPPAPLETDHDWNFVCYVVSYVPDLVRYERINIGVLLFEPESNTWRFRLIEDEEDLRHVHRWHPEVDERVIRSLQDGLRPRLARLVPGNGKGSFQSGILRCLTRCN